VAATIWLLSGLFQLVIAAAASGRSGDRLLALGGVSTVVGTAFALWPRSTPVIPGPDNSDPPKTQPRDDLSPSSPGAFHRLRSSSSGSSVQGPWTPASDVKPAAAPALRRMRG
jgi:hypothetical protein